MLNDLSGTLPDGQWYAFLYRLADEEGVLGKRSLWQSGNWSTQELDTGGFGHLLVLSRKSRVP